MGDITPRQPAIGDGVLYHPAPNDQECRHNHATVLPATVVRVWSATTLNLKVHTDGPVDAWRTSVPHASAPTELDSGHYWEWPPYVPPLASTPAGERAKGVL